MMFLSLKKKSQIYYDLKLHAKAIYYLNFFKISMESLHAHAHFPFCINVEIY